MEKKEKEWGKEKKEKEKENGNLLPSWLLFLQYPFPASSFLRRVLRRVCPCTRPHTVCSARRAARGARAAPPHSTQRLGGWMGVNGWVSEWVSEWVNEWVNEWVSEWMNEWVNEWVNEWMSEWMSEWVNEWVNEWMSEWVDKSEEKEDVWGRKEIVDMTKVFTYLFIVYTLSI